MAKNYQAMAKQIIAAIGTKDNIITFTHCFTRLRFTLKDHGLVDEAKLKQIDGVLGMQWVGEQLQIIIGQEVEALYQTICDQESLTTAPIEETNKEESPKKITPSSLISELVATITACITPIFMILTIGGLIKLLVALLGPATFGLLPEDHDLIILLTMLGDACFRFFPIFLAYTAAKRFNASIPLALLLACVMLHPTLEKIVATNTPFTVYGIPMIATTYTNTFLPTLLVTWVLAKVEAFFKKIFPSVISDLLYPLCTILVMLPLALCILGPIANILGNTICAFIMWLQDVMGPLATSLVGGFFPLLIVTGMHHALNSAAFVEYTSKGFDTCIFAATYIMDFQLTSLCFAQLIKAKKPTDKALAINCILTEGFGGISEPTLFGIILKSKRNILYTTLGGLVGGFYIGLMHVKCYVLAPGGFLGFLAYTGGSVANFVNGCIACVLAFVIPFVLALIFGMEDEKERG